MIKPQVIKRDELGLVTTPTGTDTWQPVPHESLVSEIEGSLQYHGFDVVRQYHELTHAGQRYFGTLGITRGGKDDTDYGMEVGIRNSHDKRFPAGLVIGSTVFVCSNLSFSGEIVIARKHTVRIIRDLPFLIGRTMGRVAEHFGKQRDQFDAYRGAKLNDDRARSLMVEFVKRGAMPVSALPRVLEQWEAPKHEEFEPRNAWSLFNAVTEVGKDWGRTTLVGRTRVLHGVLDAEIGYVAA
jgi:hypothetical protein